MIRFFPTLFFYLILLTGPVIAQNQTAKWYFGFYAALDFMSSPPTPLANSQMTMTEGTACMSDASGNLLFYTNGITVWNQQQLVMANGTGLFGNISSTQSALIIKQPGSNSLYYIFTAPPLHYSIVDMSLAAGMGSVTVKNVPLDTLDSEKLTATMHCNGESVWIVAHDQWTPVFHAFLLGNLGVNATPVISTSGAAENYFQGYMKISPNGKKLGLAATTLSAATGACFELFDFNNATGVVSNSLVLTVNNPVIAYGCEFSPDGTKFYGSDAGHIPPAIFQWDLCAASNPAIAASQYSIAAGSSIYALQLAPDGRIYGVTPYSASLSVIASPNNSGMACNFQPAALAISPGTGRLGLPNFMGSYFNLPALGPPPFTFTASASGCNQVSFSPGAAVQPVCSAGNYSLTGVVWNFGDPASGVNNGSSSFNPTHLYSTPGTYTVTAILYYGCRIDTLRQPLMVTVMSPVLSVSGNFTVCAGSQVSLSTTGASTYSWNGIGGNSAFTATPTASTVYTVTGMNSSGCATSKTVSVSVQPCTGMQQSLPIVRIKFYPNPVDDLLTVESERSLHISIYNSFGALVLEADLSAGRQTLDLSSLPPGLYLLESANSGFKCFGKITRI